MFGLTIPLWLRIAIGAVLLTGIVTLWSWGDRQQARAEEAEANVASLTTQLAQVQRQVVALHQASQERAADEARIDTATEKLVDEIRSQPDSTVGASRKRLGCLRIEAARGRAAAVSAGC